MNRFFSLNYSGPPFQLFGAAHIAALSMIIALCFLLSQFKNSSEPTKRILRWTLAIILWTSELSWHIWNIYWGSWSDTFMLPLNVCSVLIWLSGFMLIFKVEQIYEFAYFLGITACFNYLLTPDLGIYGFPHYRFIQIFISHGLVIISAVYMTVAEGFRPTWKSFWRVVAGTNAYMLFIYFVNLALGSNYVLINVKPTTPSLLQFMPPWPYYIAFMELIGIACFLLLYLPFLIRDWRTR
ncbi:MAG TPA: TIGR02206 family membrane protein [Anaerolineales bacterium]|nr:TIGR02206 family membrane protein [Anaerolineales bacterium]